MSIIYRTAILILTIICSASSLTGGTVASDNTGDVIGRVYLPANDTHSLADILIVAYGEGTPTALTHDDGSFTFAGLRAGIQWTFTAFLDGYKQYNGDATVTVVASTTNPIKRPEPDPIQMIKESANSQADKKTNVVLVLYRDEQSQTTSKTDDNQTPQSLPRKLAGTVIRLDDNDEKAVSGAEIRLLKIDKFANQQVIGQGFTGASGRFTIELIQTPISRSDKYLFTVTKPQFRPFIILVDFRKPLPEKITLVREKPEQRKAEIDNARINLIEATLRYVFSPRLMQSLPLAGSRNFDSFALLAPGVLPPPETFGKAGPGVSPGVGTAGQFSVNGLRSRENNFTVDGSDNNDEYVGTRRQGFVALTPQSVESLQELQVITALGDARFGRNIGGQINALSMSGDKNFHGSAYGFFTNRLLNARDFFDQTSRPGPAPSNLMRASDGAPVLLDNRPIASVNPSGGENPFTRYQAGLTAGDLLDSRSTFFISFEQQKINARQESHFAVPTVRQRGFFDTGDTGFNTRGNNSGGGFTPVSPASLPGDAIFSLYPFPNNPLGPYGENTYTAVLPADGRATRGSARIDHRFVGSSARDKSGNARASFRCPSRRWPWELWKFGCNGDAMTARYNITDEVSFLPSTGGAIFSTLRPRVRTQNLAFFFNRTFSSKTADTLRVSYGRTRLLFAEARDPYLSNSSLLPREPFLLNAPLLLNVTAPGPGGRLNSPAYVSAASREGARLLDSLGLGSVTQTEQITGPLGQVIIAGFSPLGVDVYNFPQERADNTFQLAETLTKIGDRNIYTLGFDMRKTHINNTLDRNFRPVAVFSGLIDDGGSFRLPINSPVAYPDGTTIPAREFTPATMAAAGVPTGLFHTLAIDPNSTIGIRFTQINFFFQDEIRVNSTFRLTLGMRYEVNTVPDTIGGRLEKALDPADLKRQAEQAAAECRDQGGGRPGTTRCDDLVEKLSAAFPADYKLSFGADRNDFDPRIGFAWGSKDGRRVIRGGFGVYAGQFPGIVIDQSRNAFSNFVPLNMSTFAPRRDSKTFLFNLANPGLQQLNKDLNVIAPGTINRLIGISPVSLLTNLLFDAKDLLISQNILGLDIVLPQRELKSPYAYHYALTVERQFYKDFVGSISYVGTRGVKLLRLATPDLGLLRNRVHFDKVYPLGANSSIPFFEGSISPAQLEQPEKIISSAFTIARTFFESSASSVYNSLQIEIHRRYTQHLHFGTVFTYSHSIDDSSDFFDTAGAFALPQNSIARSERASSNFDARLRSVTTFIWDTPFERSRLLRAWQLAGVLTLQSGQPYTVNTVFDINRDGNLTDRLNSTDGLIHDPVEGDRRIQLGLATNTNPLALLAPDDPRRWNGIIGRNTFRAPGIFTLDMAVARKFKINEHSNLSLRVEAFNLFNRTHFGIPVRILESPGFGSSAYTSQPARMIQFSLKYSL